VGPGFNDTATVEDDDEVDVANARETVRHDESCASSCQQVEILLDRLFGFGVKGAGGFVEKDNDGLLYRLERWQCVVLHLRELESTVADTRVVAEAAC